MDPVTLFHLAPSHHCERARKVLDVKGIPYELERVPYQDHRQVIAETGQDYVPALVAADDQVVPWREVADWAEDQVPEPTLYPGDSRGLCRVLTHWCYSVVEDVVWQYIVPDVADRFEDPHERWLFIEFQERRFGDLEHMRAKRPALLEGVREICQLAQDQLGEQTFLLGDEPSLADCALYGGLHPLYFAGKGVPKEFQALAAWRERVDEL